MEFDDPYNHDDFSLIYSPENIPTQDSEEDFNEQFTTGCNCEDLCIPKQCLCINNSGTSYKCDLKPTDMQRENIYDDYIINVQDNQKPIYECHSRCACYGKICGNRLVQFGPRKCLKIIACDNEVTSNKKIKLERTNESTVGKNAKGYGLMSTKSIKQGNFICEYAGEIISKEEALKRHEINEKEMLMNYIICVNEYFGETNRSTYVDPSKFGNIGRYLNHSCQPNCKIIPIRVNNTFPKLCFFSIEDIKENEELTFDYGNDENNPKTTTFHNRKKCLCGTVKCRKYLPFSNYSV